MARRKKIQDFGGSIHLDQATQSIITTADGGKLGDRSFTITTRFRGDRSTPENPTNGNYQCLVNRRSSGSSNAAGFVLTAWGGLFFRVADGTNNTMVLLDQDTLNVLNNKWHEAIAVREAGVELRLYLDGVLVGSTPDTTVGDIDLTNRWLCIGGEYDGTTRYLNFDGNIADVQIYDGYAFSDAEAEEHYFEGTQPTPPRNWWKLNEQSGTTAVDSGYEGLNGSMLTDDRWSKAAPSTPRLRAGSSYNSISQPDTASQSTVSATDPRFDTTDLTMSIWVNPKNIEDSTHYQGLMTLSDGTTSNRVVISARQNAAGEFVTYWDNVNNGQPTTHKLTNSVWQHVVLTKEGRDIVVYVDGFIVHTQTLSNDAPSGFDRLTIGSSGFASEYFVGEWTEAQFFTEALDKEDIQLLYTSGSCSAEPLVRYNCTDQEGATVTDSSGNGLDGTITISTWSMESPAPPRQGIVEAPFSLYSTATIGSLVYWDPDDIEVFNTTGWTAAFRVWRPDHSGLNEVFFSISNSTLGSTGPVVWAYPPTGQTDKMQLLIVDNAGTFVYSKICDDSMKIGWNDVVLIDDGGEMIVLINGRVQPTMSASYVNTNITMDQLALLGSYRGTGQSYRANMAVGDLQIWDRAITFDEAEQWRVNGVVEDTTHSFYPTTGTGSKFIDSVQGVNGNIAGNVSWDRRSPSPVRQSVLDCEYSLYNAGATTDFVEWPSNTLPVWNTTGYSFAMWIRTDNITITGRNNVFFSQGLTTSSNPLVELLQSTADATKVQMFIRNTSGGTVLNATSTASLRKGWNHIVWSDDGGDAHLTINGLPDATDFSYTPTGTMTLDRTVLHVLAIGASTANPFEGLITGFTVWQNTALSVKDAIEFYRSAAPNGATNRFPTITGSGTTLVDVIGGVDGTINGTLTWEDDSPSKSRVDV